MNPNDQPWPQAGGQQQGPHGPAAAPYRESVPARMVRRRSPPPSSHRRSRANIDPHRVCYVAADDRVYGMVMENSDATQKTDAQVFAFG